MSPTNKSLSSPPRATPHLTFLVSVCIAELRDSVYSICDAVYSIQYKLKIMVEKLCGNYGKKVLWKIVLKNWLEELGGEIG